jgi:hypothetical protein
MAQKDKAELRVGGEEDTSWSWARHKTPRRCGCALRQLLFGYSDYGKLEVLGSAACRIGRVDSLAHIEWRGDTGPYGRRLK